MFRILVAVLLLVACNKPTDTSALPSWGAGDHRDQILAFVDDISDVNSPNFVPAEDRIAVFDNDGTLWCEKPLYPHFFVLFNQVEKKIKLDPTLKNQEPYKSLHNFIATKDPRSLAYFVEAYEKGEFNFIVGQLMGVPFEGMSPEEFSKEMHSFYNTWKHPKFNTDLDGLTYQPMKELVNLLKQNDFKVYIFTADEGAFLKLYSQELYGILPEHVHGTDVEMNYQEGQLFRTDQGQYLDNWDAKARKIFQILGKQPILAAGNSNGDFEMLQYTTTSNPYNSLSIMIHHTDSIREFKYDSHTERVLPYARKNGYVVVDMEKDWITIF